MYHHSDQKGGFDCANRFFNSDYSQELHDVGMSELSHDGRLLQEPDSVLGGWAVLEHLDSHLPLSPGRLPDTFLDSSKLPRAQMS